MTKDELLVMVGDYGRFNRIAGDTRRGIDEQAQAATLALDKLHEIERAIDQLTAACWQAGYDQDRELRGNV